MTFSQPDPSPYPPAAPAPTGAVGNTPGRASLVAGIIIVVVGLAQTLFNYGIPSLMAQFDLGTSQVSLLYLPFTIVIGVLAVVAVILGIIGLARQGAPKAAAGAGTALGASALLSVLFGLVASALAYAVF